MNELCDAENLWIEVYNIWTEIKNILLLQRVIWANQREKKKVGKRMIQRTKSGLCDTFIKLMACQQDTDEYFCRIKMATQCLKINHCAADLSGSATPLEYKHSLTSTSWLKVSQRKKNWTFCWQEKIFYMALNQFSIQYTFEFKFKWFSFTKKGKINCNSNKPLTHLKRFFSQANYSKASSIMTMSW